MASIEEDRMFHKSFRVVILSILLVFAGLFYFLFKIGQCRPEEPSCKDAFIEIKEDSSYNAGNAKCDPGASVEAVTEPKRGIFCRCPRPNGPSAPSPAP